MHDRARRVFVYTASLYAASVVACAGGPPPASPAAAPAGSPETAPDTGPAPERTPPAPAACLPPATAGTGVAHVAVTGGRALACYLDGQQSTVEAGRSYPCVEVDLESRKIVAAKTWTAKAPPETTSPAEGAFEVTTTKTSVKVCPRGSKTCSTVKVRHKHVPAGHGDSSSNGSLIASVNEDGSRVFVFAAELKPGQPKGQTTSSDVYGDVYEVKTGKRLLHVDLHKVMGGMFSDPSNTWSARFIGKNLVLDDYSCCGPGGATALLDPEKPKGAILHGYDGNFEKIGENLHYARDGKKLMLIDANTVTTLVSYVADGTPIDDPEQSNAMTAVDGQKLVVAYANRPGLFVIDTKTRNTSGAIVVPICEADVSASPASPPAP